MVSRMGGRVLFRLGNKNSGQPGAPGAPFQQKKKVGGFLLGGFMGLKKERNEREWGEKVAFFLIFLS